MTLRTMSTWTRYLLIQVPGWILAATLLYLIRGWIDLPDWVAVLLLVVYIAKDFVLYPLVYRAYEFKTHQPGHELIGRPAVTRQRLEPRGYVRVGGELWIAEVASSVPSIPPGRPVTIVGVEGNTLIVTPSECQDGVE